MATEKYLSKSYILKFTILFLFLMVIVSFSYCFFIHKKTVVAQKESITKTPVTVQSKYHSSHANYDKTIFVSTDPYLKNNVPTFSVYRVANGIESILLKEVEYTEKPELLATDDPNIVLVRVISQKLGPIEISDSYINLDTKEIFKIDHVERHLDFSIEKNNNQIVRVVPSVTDDCRINNKNGFEMLKGLDANRGNLSFNSLNQLFKCSVILNKSSFGPIAAIHGFNKDFSKIYFTVTLDDGKNAAWTSSYSLELNTKVIKEEEPIDLLYNPYNSIKPQNPL